MVCLLLTKRVVLWQCSLYSIEVCDGHVVYTDRKPVFRIIDASFKLIRKRQTTEENEQMQGVNSKMYIQQPMLDRPGFR